MMPRGATDTGHADNARIAAMLREAATLLAAQQANPFRVAAYRKAADTIATWPDGARAVFERGGREGLDALPAVGPGLASAIAEILVTGRWRQLDRLRGEVDGRLVFRSVPGIGPELSERIHDELGVDTLESLEAAAHNGRLETVRGVGPRRASAIRASLAHMLRRAYPAAVARSSGQAEPPVEMLLDVDSEYRAKAKAGALPTIAPRRFNPRGEAWLPLLHTQRGPWHLTALFSNTATAHQFGREHDWVVLYFHQADQPEGVRTVVTETRGPLSGRRVVRGREVECQASDRAATAPAAAGPPAPEVATSGSGAAG
jgi:hypothetical protein